VKWRLVVAPGVLSAQMRRRGRNFNDYLCDSPVVEMTLCRASLM
jgi:hypothetical protein